MFVGRDQELKQLESWFHTPGFHMPVIYGRRRVGKTRLINEFTQDKRTIFFTAIEDDGRTNLINLSQSIFSFLQHKRNASGAERDFATAPVYASFQEAFRAIAQIAQTERTVFVIDEFPYLAQSDPSISSLLQMLIDTLYKQSELYLVLCGSSMSFMEEQVLGYKSPLYGRRTGQMRIEPLSFFEARHFFPEVGIEKALSFYGMVGGVPLYLEQLKPQKSVLENIDELFCNASSILYEEPQNLLKQEVRDASRYNTIVGAIAGGKTKSSEIAGTVGIATGALDSYLRRLQSLGIIERKTPITDEKSKKSIYSISDNLFKFWYRFIPRNKSFIEGGRANLAGKRIESLLPDYLGFIFEDVCRQWLWQQAQLGDITTDFDRLGSWWGNDPRRKSEAEIDLVGINNNQASLFAECKWRNELLDVSVLEELLFRSELLPKQTTAMAEYFLFSKKGFTKACTSAAEVYGDVRLVKAADMI